MHKVDESILRMIVDQHEQAHDALALVEQFLEHLPIRNFDELKAVVAKRPSDKKDTVTFRGKNFHIQSFDGIPKEFFPISDLETLVERALQISRMVPGHIGLEDNETEQIKRSVRRSPFPQMARGLIGPDAPDVRTPSLGQKGDR